MEAIKSATYHPVPAVRSSKVKQSNGMQKLYTKIINKIEDLPPNLHTKLQQKPVACSLVRSSPVNRPVTKVRSPPVKKSRNIDGKNDSMILSDDDEFYSKLTFDDSEQSLEDEIFEELEKVAHDEAKLNAALQNFDRILLEYNDKKAKEQKAVESRRDEKPSAIPKPLQKSKTCSIIESKCILKKQDEKKKNIPAKVEKPLNVENFGSIPSANCYQVTKSLWNLQDFDDFAKSAQKKTQLGPRKSDGAVPSRMMSRAKSVWDMTPTTPLASSPPRPTYSRQSSISKIPIKSSKLSSSMMQLNASNSTLNSSYCSPSPRLSKSSAYASTLSLTSASQTPSKLSAIRRSSLCLVSKKAESPSMKSISKYAETKTSIQRRNMISSTNSINKMSISIAPSKSISSPMKSAKSEMSLNGRLVPLQSKQKQGNVDPVPANRVVQMKAKRDGDSLLDKCLVKGQELLRKAEEFNDANRDDDKAKTVVAADARKRDYIAKHQPASLSSSSKKASIVSMNTKSSSANVNSIKAAHHKDANETLNVNAITNHCTVDNQTGNHQQRQIESETTVEPVSQPPSTRTTESTETIVVVGTVLQSPTLESCEIIPVVLDATQRTDSSDKVDGDTAKDYSSDCSDDSGHISNENEDLTLKMDALKPRKISEELLEIFEKKKISPTKAKVIELNHVNLIKTSMEIYPTLNKTCKSEVTFFINQY